SSQSRAKTKVRKNPGTTTPHDTITPFQDRHQERQNTQVLQPPLKSAGTGSASNTSITLRFDMP
ncbi:hypothetical protein, partial [Bifidobacterium jacchi]|uniref:hypothetical protein n=1 Tax=Bifidobacterium jacchi TaxID=2490545 RepID=UPI0019D5F979